MSDRLAPTERHAFLHQGRTIYEWDQTLSEVNIYVQLPPGARAKQLYVDITSARLRIGITPGQPYLDVRWPACAAAHMGSKGPLHATSRPDLMCRHWPQHELVGRVKPSDSFWTVGAHATARRPEPRGSRRGRVSCCVRLFAYARRRRRADPAAVQGRQGARGVPGAPGCATVLPEQGRTCLLRGVGAWGDARVRRPARQGEPWAAALAGHALDPLRQQSEQKRLLLERFQEEARPRAASRCGKALSPASKRERTPPLHTVTLCSAVSPHASRSA